MIGSCAKFKLNRGRSNTFYEVIMADTADHMLLEAAKMGDFALIETLILRPDGAGRTARLEYRDRRNGWTALHYACANGHMSCVSMLLQLGSNPTVGTGRRCDNITPVHLASSAGFGEIVTLLVHYGADVSKVDFNGSTARDHAGMMAESMTSVSALCRRDCELILRVQETTEEWASKIPDPPRLIQSNHVDMNPELSRVVQMSVGGSERLSADCALFLTLRGSVLTWGNNSDSQLGSLGDTKKTIGGGGAGHFHELRLVPALARQNIRCEQVSVGVRHSVILMSNGWAATSGEGFNGQLGLGSGIMRCTQYTPIYFPPPHVQERVKCVAAGLYHTFLITVNGNLYSMGSNKKGQLGIGDRADRMDPMLVKLPSVSESGGEGGGGGGGGGSGSSSSSKKKSAKSGLSWDPQYVVCGELHSIVVCRRHDQSLAPAASIDTPSYAALSCGTVVSTGHAGSRDSLVFRVIADLDACIVTCGAKHTVNVTSNGAVYSWGCGTSGQLGHGDRSFQARPKIIGFFVEGKAIRKVKVVAAAAGSRHTILLSEPGELFAMGANNYGQLGRGDRRDSLLPKEIHLCMPSGPAEKHWRASACGGRDGDPPHPALIAAGGCCTFVCTQNGLVLHFGSNSRDDLKRQEFPDHLEATPLELPDDDDDTPEEKRRKLRKKIADVEQMFKKKIKDDDRDDEDDDNDDNGDNDDDEK